MQAVEFCVENSGLYLLETRDARRTPQAAVRVARDMCRECVVTEREAVMKLRADQMRYCLRPAAKLLPPPPPPLSSPPSGAANTNTVNIPLVSALAAR